VREVGFEPPSRGDVSPLRRFFADSFPFFSFYKGIKVLAKKNLAGDKTHESKSSQLPLLWQDLVRRSLELEKPIEPRKCRLPSLWRSESLERCKTVYSVWSDAALLVQKMLLSFFTLVAVLRAFFLFSLLDYILYYSRRLFLDV
jgi:hypothetical protein